MERLWSYIRRFSKITQEIRPSDRVDVLVDALLLYSRHSAHKLGTELSWPVNIYNNSAIFKNDESA